MINQERLTELQSYREPLNKGELTLHEFLENNNLALSCESLTHFAHWITPPMMPKRFDTHFYVARAPEDQLAMHDGYESVDSVWITPKDAIDQEKEGKRTIIFPTLRNIEKLGEAASVSDNRSKRGDNTGCHGLKAGRWKYPVFPLKLANEESGRQLNRRYRVEPFGKRSSL